MSLWVRLLALLVACLRVSGAAGVDPLPAALVDLVRSSSITSIEDLQLLLFSDSLDQEEEGSPVPGGHRSPRSLNAQPAQQALCKVRTEVVEVTRDMLDRSNAHFLLWPPCVEVQRCSGCCNGNTLQCVPVLTHTRYLQVMKIQYINQKATYDKAVVSVVDHVECRCQPVPRPPAPKKKSSRRGPVPNKDQHHNQTIDQQQGLGKSHSKEELHRQDEIKKNQRVHLEKLLEQHWSPRGDTFTPPEEEQHYSPAGAGAGAGGGASHSGGAVLRTPHWVHNASRLLETNDSTGIQGKGAGQWGPTSSPLDVPGAGVEGPGGAVEPSLSLNSTEERARMDLGLQKNADRHRETQRGGERSTDPKSHEKDLDTPNQQVPSIASNQDGGGGRFRPTKEPNPDPPGKGRHGGNETPEQERKLQMEEAQLEEERRELLLLHKRLDREKELIRLQQLKQEEEREQEKESGQQPHLQYKQHHHLQTTTQNIVTTSPSTTPTPVTPDAPRAPARPNQRRRRLKKNRKKISKAAMRAMLM
ncbi:uncharacterized protein pdgfbb [Gadus chalcogrammus]|uniref:uncharacterized protein pdgfbb n=1 Tax=Gadus chalcogrammus TaxID=1042646 RepID=UPI0024C322F0|nr:uncharacterized protein pdgfbb [Gadus chalcogrammus]